MACAFGTVSHVWDGKAYVERVQRSEEGFKHLTEGEDMVVSQDGHMLLCFASSCSSLPISPWTSRGSGCILVLSSFLFLRQSSRSFVFTLITIFCHFDIATMKMDVCVQATLCILKWDRSWSYTPTPPTENTLCKITVEPPLTYTPYSGHLAYAATWTWSRLKRY